MDHYLKDELYELVKSDSSIFDFIQEGSLDGVWYWDLENPENEWMSKKFWTELGYNPVDMPHKASAWQDIINQDDLALAIDNFNKHCANPNHPYDQIVRYTHKNGSTIYIRCRGLAIRDTNGNPIRMLGAHTNITAIKKIQEEQEKKEKTWRSVFKNMNDGFQIIDENFRYIYLNKRTEQLSKYKAGSLIGKTMVEMYPGIENTEIFNAIKKVIETKETISLANDFTFPNGTVETHYNTIQPFENGVCIFTSDIPGKLKKINRELRESNELIYKLTQQVPGVIYQYRSHPDGKNYFPYSSNKIWDIYEVTPEQVKEDASLVLSKIHPEDFDQVMKSITQSYETLELWEDTYRVNLPKKGVRWLYGQAQPEKLEDDSVLWHGYIQDITEKYEDEKALSDSEKRWKFALEGAKDGVWDWNLETNEVYFSNQLKAMLGFHQDEITDNFDEWRKRIHTDDLERSYNRLQKHLNNETEIYSNIHRVFCKNGDYKWFLDRGKIIEKDSNNKAVRMVGTYTDLTERMEIERKLSEKNKELEQFSYIASHDLQEPLNSIISFSNLLEDSKGNLDEIGKKSIDIIVSSAYRMKEFIISLLEYSRIGREKEKIKVTIKQLIKNLKVDLHDLINKEEATIEFIGKPLEVMAFEPDLIKLFQNLVINAIKYTDENTKPLIVIDAKEENGKYLFSIQDNGIGIEENQFEKIFEVFQRLHTREKYSGTGIGLSHCKKVVELHNGEIWLKSKVGKGSTFYFTISKE